MPPYGAVYDPASGLISRMFSSRGADEDAAQLQDYIDMGFSPANSALIYSDTAIDNSMQMVDDSSGTAVLIDTPPPMAQNVLEGLVNDERASRIVRGKVFDGVYVTGSDTDRQNFDGLVRAAEMRLAGGSTAPFDFRDGYNAMHSIPPEQMISLWQQSAAYVEALYNASWALKDNAPIPQDYWNDAYWPDNGFGTKSTPPIV
jgi:hypothetical protein